MSDQRSAIDRLNEAMRAYLEEIGAIDEGDVVTHWMIIAASSSMSSPTTGVSVSTGPHDFGLATWEQRGLLSTAERYVMDEDVYDDEDKDASGDGSV